MDSGADTARAVGFPIRKSTDQSLLAAPHGLSQRATSFVASQRQGIHPMPLLCSILEMVSRNSPTQRHAQDQAPSRRTRARDGSQLCQTSRSRPLAAPGSRRPICRTSSHCPRPAPCGASAVPASRRHGKTVPIPCRHPRSLPASTPRTLSLAGGALVEVNGFEPMTPCLQSRCSPS